MKATLLVLFLVAATVQAQVAPSSFTPLAPCRLYDSVSAVSAGFTVFVDARGYCNVPSTANAIAAQVLLINPSGPGYALLYEDGIVRPLASTLAQSSGTEAAGTTARLCYPSIECAHDLDLYTSTAGRLVVDVTGYFEPLP